MTHYKQRLGIVCGMALAAAFGVTAASGHGVGDQHSVITEAQGTSGRDIASTAEEAPEKRKAMTSRVLSERGNVVLDGTAMTHESACQHGAIGGAPIDAGEPADATRATGTTVKDEADAPQLGQNKTARLSAWQRNGVIVAALCAVGAGVKWIARKWRSATPP